MKINLFYGVIVGLAFFSVACNTPKPTEEICDITRRINGRDFPSVFQAWYGIDMPGKYPDTTLALRLQNAAKHDLIWEEPLSQLGEGVDLVLGLVWDHENHGLADDFTKESLDLALENRNRMLEMNPNMVFLFEVRWRDAPMSFLPDSSNWWLRDENGEIKKGWLGGWEPFYLLDYNNADWQDNVARQCKIALESGVYDGVMFDWSGNLEIIQKTRAAIGDDALIIVNIHDDIHDGRLYAPYINGAFMELNPLDSISLPVDELVLFSGDDVNGRQWDNIRAAVKWFQDSLRAPQVVCNEVWGNRNDLSRMRAVTTMTLVYSNGYTLYADPNPLKTPDHLHDWYEFWDAPLGRPVNFYIERPDGSVIREYDGGTVLYNHYGNEPTTIIFNRDRKRVSDGTVGKSFVVNGRDGDIFLQLKK
jgi:hypothetical protein